jgi:hypothetical protein
MKEDIDIFLKNWRNIPIVSTQLFMQDFPYLKSPWDHWNKVVDALKNSQDPSIHIDENDENAENAENTENAENAENADNADNVDNVEDDNNSNSSEKNNSNLKDESFEVKIETGEQSESTDKNTNNVDWVQSDDEL